MYFFFLNSLNAAVYGMWGTETKQNMFADIFSKLDEIQYISHMIVNRNIPLCMLLRELSVLSATV